MPVRRPPKVKRNLPVEKKQKDQSNAKKPHTSAIFQSTSTNDNNMQVAIIEKNKSGYDENGNDDNMLAVSTNPAIRRLSDASDFLGKWKWVETMCNDISNRDNSKVRRPDDVWIVIDSICSWSSSSGLTMDQLKKTWILVTGKNSPLNEGQKAKCLHCLIPTEKVHESFVVEVLNWLLRKSMGTPNSVISGVIILLYGWNLYGLLETDLLSNPVTYTRLLNLCFKLESMIPWLCVLIRKVTSARYLTSRHISMLYSLSQRAIGEDCIQFIMELLYFYQYLRPDLFPLNPPYLQWKKYSNSMKTMKTNLLQANLRKALYGAKKRCISRSDVDDLEDSCFLDENRKQEDIKDVDSINQMFFDEFAPKTIVEVDVASLGLLCSTEAMLVMLRKEETLPLLACDSEAMEFFNVYASLVFYHQFPDTQKNDYAKCLFMLDRCYRLSIFVNDSLNAVTDWLVNFLPTWDGELFNFFVYELLRFVPLHVFSERFSHITKKLCGMFASGTSMKRLRIWSTLEEIIMRWPIKFLNSEELKSAAEDFFLFIHSLICKFAAIGGHNDNLILTRICNTYLKIIPAYISTSVQPHIPVELARMAILNDTLPVLDCCSKLYIALSMIPKQSQMSANSFKFKQEMCLFYAKKEGLPFQKLFKTEHDAILLKEQASGESEPGVTNFKAITTNLNCFHSSCLRVYCVNPTRPLPISFKSKHFRWTDLKMDAKYVHKNLVSHCPEIAKSRENTMNLTTT